MKIQFSLLILMMALKLHAEPTPPGTTPTYTTSEGNSFTLYYKNGDVVPPGTRMFISPVGTQQLLNADGSTGDSVFRTQADATAARNAQPDCSGTVFGPGPAPAACSAGGVKAETAVDDGLYDKTSFELSTVLFSSIEIGIPSCAPAGAKMPGSLDSWGKVLRNYSAGEKSRDKLLSERVATVQKKIEELTGANKQSKDMQIESIDLQIQLVEASIESMNGASGRIPIREALLLGALKSTETNGKENIKTVEAYKKMVNDNFESSVKAATAACDRKKKIKECTTDEEGVETCVEKEVKDPVPGCDVALAQIPVIRTGPAQAYGETYLMASFPSTQMNNKMQKHEEEMTIAMAAIPRSSDAEYDWSSPMEDGLKLMKEARKESGTKCADGSEAAGKAKVTVGTQKFLTSLGISEDNTSAETKKLKETFENVWKAADNVIGQAGHRGKYFEYVGGKTNTLLGMDRKKLQTLMDTKSRLEKYKAQVKLALTPGAGSSGGAGGKTTAQTNLPAPKMMARPADNESTGTGVSSVKKAIGFSANGESTTPANIPLASGVNASFNGGIAAGINGTSKLSAGSINKVESLSLGSSALAQVKKTLDGINKNDKKLSGFITTTPVNDTASKSKGSDSGIKAAKTVTIFTMPDNSTGPDSVSGSIESAFTKLSATPGAEELYKSSSYGGGYNSDSYGGRYSSGGYSGGSSGKAKTTSTMMGYSKPEAGAKSDYKSSPGISALKKRSASDGPVSEDARLVSQIIAAKKFKKKDEYETSENDSLFQRVTKAYIRNYEKVEEPIEVVEP